MGEKKKMLERALKLDEEYLGPNHRDVAVTLTNLANACGRLGDVQKRESMLERAYKIKLDAYGAKNAELAPTLFNLASAKEDLKKRNEARECMTRAKDIFQAF